LIEKQRPPSPWTTSPRIPVHRAASPKPPRALPWPPLRPRQQDGTGAPLNQRRGRLPRLRLRVRWRCSRCRPTSSDFPDHTIVFLVGFRTSWTFSPSGSHHAAFRRR
jgi:hypothetical protein